MMQQLHRPGERGFTLAEMVMVAALLAILAGMALPVAKFTVKRRKETELRFALRQMRKLAETSIDFDEAEQERVQDGALSETYAQHLPPSTGNLYLMPSGRLVNADDTIYAPTVIAEKLEEKRANDKSR